jgi:hypothetical protein
MLPIRMMLLPSKIPKEAIAIESTNMRKKSFLGVA